MRRGPKRTKLQREADLLETERLHNRGLSERRIAERLHLDCKQIHYDLKKIEKRYHAAQMEERDAHVKRKLRQLREIEWEAWEAWEKSKDDVHREVKEAVRRVLEPKPGGNQDILPMPREKAVEKIKTLETIEKRLPANEYLGTIIKCLQEECELCGLYPPKELRHAGPKGEPFKVYLGFDPADV